MTDGCPLGQALSSVGDISYGEAVIELIPREDGEAPTRLTFVHVLAHMRDHRGAPLDVVYTDVLLSGRGRRVSHLYPHLDIVRALGSFASGDEFNRALMGYLGHPRAARAQGKVIGTRGTATFYLSPEEAWVEVNGQRVSLTPAQDVLSALACLSGTS